MQDNFVSIILPVKNAEKYIKDSVDSVLSQSYRNFELLILDDGSNDSTLKILESYNDNRIKLYKNESKGLIWQLNFGLSVSRGNLIARMDADDLVMPEKLQLQVDFLSNHKEIGLVGTNFEFVDESGKLVMQKSLPENHSDIEFMMPFIDSVLHSSILIYKNILVGAGGYNPEYVYAEDDELFLRLLLQGCEMYNIQKVLYKYRMINRSYEHYEKQKKEYYKCGLDYLRKKYDEKNDDYLLRLALLEYYRGSIKMARKYFIKCLEYKTIKKKIIFRYLSVTLLGERVVSFLRKIKITSKINSFFYNKFKIDTYNIKGSEVIK